MKLRKILFDAFSIDFPISGGFGASVDTPIVLDENDARDYVGTEYESPEYTDKSISENQDKSTNKESLIGDILKMIFGKSGYHDDDNFNSTKRSRKKKRRYGRQI